MTGAFKAADGTAVAPSVTFGSDTDTGLFKSNTNQIGISSAGSQVGFIDSTGMSLNNISLSGGLTAAGAVTFSGAFTTSAMTVSGAASTGNLSATGTVSATGDVRVGSGVLRLDPGAGSTHFLWWTGTKYTLGAAGDIWHTGNLSASAIVQSLRLVAAGIRAAGDFVPNVYVEPISGAIMTGANFDGSGHVAGLVFRYLQMEINGSWVTVAYV